MNWLLDTIGPLYLYGFGAGALFALGWWVGQVVRIWRYEIRLRRFGKQLREQPSHRVTTNHWDARYRRQDRQGKVSW